MELVRGSLLAQNFRVADEKRITKAIRDNKLHPNPRMSANNYKMKKNITINTLARMIAKGFEETAKAKEVNAKFAEVDERFAEVNERFGEVNERLDRIERILFWEYKHRIEKLEDEIKELRADYRELVSMKK